MFCLYLNHLGVLGQVVTLVDTLWQMFSIELELVNWLELPLVQGRHGQLSQNLDFAMASNCADITISASHLKGHCNELYRGLPRLKLRKAKQAAIAQTLIQLVMALAPNVSAPHTSQFGAA